MSWGENVDTSASASGVSVCPRHPDRQAYVRCQRCGRPMCTSCQRQAPVGMQCVDCVNEAKSGTPRVRPSFGSPARSSGKPVVGYTLIALCVLVYIAQLAVPGVTAALQYAPAYTMRGFPFEPWRMLTSAFAHSTTMYVHIVFNMVALFMLARVLEPAIGPLRFLLIYLISALGGSVGVLLLSQPLTPVVGASGAIFGLFGAMFVLQRRMGADVSGIVATLVLNAVISFFGAGIAWQAHVGGLVVGVIAALILAYTPPGRHQARTQYLLLGALTLVLIGVSWLKYTSVVPIG